MCIYGAYDSFLSEEEYKRLLILECSSHVSTLPSHFRQHEFGTAIKYIPVLCHHSILFIYFFLNRAEHQQGTLPMG